MSEHLLEREQRVNLGQAETFELYGDAFNLEAITPPLLRFRVVSPAPVVMGVGTLIEYRLRLHGVPIRWLTRIDVWEPGVRFVDRQIRGPYALWHHTHEFFPDGPDATVMHDRVRYALPLGPAGEIARRLFVARDLERIFDFRRAEVERRLRPAHPTDRG